MPCGDRVGRLITLCRITGSAREALSNASEYWKRSYPVEIAIMRDKCRSADFQRTRKLQRVRKPQPMLRAKLCGQRYDGCRDGDHFVLAKRPLIALGKRGQAGARWAREHLSDCDRGQRDSQFAFSSRLKHACEAVSEHRMRFKDVDERCGINQHAAAYRQPGPGGLRTTPCLG